MLRPCTNQPIDFYNKPIDWFLFHENISLVFGYQNGKTDIKTWSRIATILIVTILTPSWINNILKRHKL